MDSNGSASSTAAFRLLDDPLDLGARHTDRDLRQASPQASEMCANDDGRHRKNDDCQQDARGPSKPPVLAQQRDRPSQLSIAHAPMRPAEERGLPDARTVA